MARGEERSVEVHHASETVDESPGLFEQAPCGFLSTTADGTIIAVNETFLDWTGYARAELVQRRRFAELLSVGGRIYHETHYAPMLQMQGSARQIALEIVCADGARLPVLVNSVVDRDAPGGGDLIRTAVFDATERRMYEQELLRAKQRAEESERRARLLVRTLQQILIPPSPPAIPGLDLAAVYRPAGDGSEVGGDFYDVFEVGTDDWIVVVGDVVGKGVEAAIVTAMARHAIRSAAIRNPEPELVLHELNDVLLRETTDRQCTAVVVRLRRRESVWAVDSCAGGHPLPELARTGVRPTPLGRPGTLMGAFAELTLTPFDDELHPGDALVLYTDGVTEGRRGPSFFGEDRLRASISTRGASAEELAEGLLEDVLGFQEDDARDDVVVVVVRVPPADLVSPRGSS